jgi:predicted hydrocarbon binding protein
MTTRKSLGSFNSIVCFKAVITGVEDTLGEDGAAVVFTRAGRVRGVTLAKELGLNNIDFDRLPTTLNAALGKEGTKLCIVTDVKRVGSVIEIDTQETVCSAGEAPGSERKCTFTLGAIWGALETLTGEKYIARHTESVLRGGTSDKFVFTPQ